MEKEVFDLREIETRERPDVRDLLERGPPFDFFISLMSSCVPYGRSFCTSLQMWWIKDGFLSLIDLQTAASFSCIYWSLIAAILYLNLLCR